MQQWGATPSLSTELSIGEGAYVAPHSVIMKDEHLLPHRHYEGAPTR